MIRFLIYLVIYFFIQSVYIGNEDLIIYYKVCNEVQIYFYIGGKVEKFFNKYIKGYKGYLLKKLVGELFIFVSCFDILKYENYVYLYKRNCKYKKNEGK